MTWWHYLLLANVYLTLFFVFYALFLRKETFFNLNRVYLVSSALLSFFIPLIHSNRIKALHITQRVQETIYQVGPSVMQRFNEQATASHQLTLGQILCAIYISGIVFLTFKLIYQLAVINWVINQPKTDTTYSFFNRIKLEERSVAHTAINAHEEVHVRQWHSADVLLLEAIMIINWFNPVVYLYRNAVKHIHEFIADRDAIKAGNGKAEYAMLLLSQTFVTPPYHLVNPFFNSSLLKLRIQMLHKSKSHRAMLLKYGLSAPLFALMLVLSSATVNNSKTIQAINKTASQVFATPAGSIATGTGDLSAVDMRDLTAAIRQSVKAGANIRNDSASTDKINQPTLTAVEQPAQFPGGVSGLITYFSQNMNYPLAASEKKIEGKVYLTFVVEKDGSLSDIHILRDPGAGLGEEAIRVIKNSPKWQPAIQNGNIVRSQFTIPVAFTLSSYHAIDTHRDTTFRIADRAKIPAITTERLYADTSSMEAHFTSNVKNQPQPAFLATAKLANVRLGNTPTTASAKGLNLAKDKAVKNAIGEKTTGGFVKIITKHMPFFSADEPVN